MKGKLFRMDKVEGVRGVSIFDNPKLMGESFQVVANLQIEKKGESVCKNFPYKRGDYRPEDVFLCFEHFCQSLDKETSSFHRNAFYRNPGDDSNRLTLPERFYGNCPYKL